MQKNRYNRQSFLGNQDIFKECTVGIVGLGGGGSHIVQQLAHIGFSQFNLFDYDLVEDSNLNRMVGATIEDVKQGRKKIAIAERVIKSLNPAASIGVFDCRWQEAVDFLKECDIVFGCVDSYSGRHELEICTRRYMIPYIDIGMDVYCLSGQPPRMSGQVILSLPEGPCMFCLDFLNEKKLAKEASKYGDAGIRPQVVWSNGILASAAVGIAVDLFTGWTASSQDYVYLSYDGNKSTLSHRLIPKSTTETGCPHYTKTSTGDPVSLKL